MSSTEKMLKKLQTKKGVIQAIAFASFVVFTTVIGSFTYQVRKHKNATMPLGFRPVGKAPKITDRSGDIVKDRYHPSKTKVPENIDYIVIGSGISGLAAAACLSRVGRRVLVLEQHDRIGGCLHQYSKGYQFDTGIHYVGKPWKYGKLLAPITSKDQPVEWVAMGRKEDGYEYDTYLIGGGDDMVTFRARAKSRKEDLKKQFNTKQDHEAIEAFYKLQEPARILAVMTCAGKLLGDTALSRLLWRIAKWKYPELWGKTAKDIFDTIFKHNKLLGMAVMANIGDMGGGMAQNAMFIICGLFGHYKDGGYFINGGPQRITRSIMPVIEASGGRCLANAPVEEIIFENNRAVGVVVKAKKGNKIKQFRARCGVIATAGFVNLYTKFAPLEKLPKSVSMAHKLQIQRLLNTIRPSPQHFHIFLGFEKTSEELGFTSSNRWYLQCGSDEDYDYDKFIDRFHKDPLHAPVMGFLSFPSAKNPDFARERPGKATAILLTEIPYYHFAKWKDGKHDARGSDYVELKEKIANRMIEELLYKYYPKTRGNIAKMEIGTALSAKYYLGSPKGESYGLGHQVERYFDWEINQLLKPRQAVKGLFFGGQDVLTAGFASALESGIWCAESALGYHKASVMLAGRTLIGDLNKMDGYQQEKRNTVEDYDFNNYISKSMVAAEP